RPTRHFFVPMSCSAKIVLKWGFPQRFLGRDTSSRITSAIANCTCLYLHRTWSYKSESRWSPCQRFHATHQNLRNGKPRSSGQLCTLLPCYTVCATGSTLFRMVYIPDVMGYLFGNSSTYGKDTRN
ncbi:hypothetical protein JI435_304400, partial [Parastagonospora nodorum SN15]